MGYVTVEAAQALQEMGYGQDGWPQAVWWREFMQRVKAWSEWEITHLDEHNLGPHTLGATRSPKDEWLAAPDELTALMWLEQERGYRWFRNPLFYEAEWQAWPRMVLASSAVVADTASALIMVIAEHWRTAQGQKQEEDHR